MADFLHLRLQRVSPSIFAVLLCVYGSAPAAAETLGGRFQLKESGGGEFVRLDSETGAMSICRREGETWTCKSMADDRAALHEEIAKLKKDNAALTERLNAPGNALPNEADLDRVMSLFEKYVERFLSFIAKLDRQHNNQGI